MVPFPAAFHSLSITGSVLLLAEGGWEQQQLEVNSVQFAYPEGLLHQKSV